MMPINRPVRIVTRDGRTIRGRRHNEDTYTVQIIDEQERLVSLDKSDHPRIRGDQDLADAAGHEDAQGEELADVIAYLLSLRGHL